MKVAIVGSGPGGITTAKVLTDAGADVTVFEKGPFVPQTASVRPFSTEEMDKKYCDRGITVAMGKPKISYVEGACLGGGSEVNAGLYHRTPEHALAQWRQEWGLTDLTTETLLPHFEASERALNVCKMPFTPPPASLKLVEGARKLGWNCVEAPRWYKYTSETDKGVFSGIRQSMTEAVLPTIDTERLNIKISTSIEKIIENKNGTPTLVFRDQSGRAQESGAFDTVFVSGGAISTPWLLKRSHLGPKHVGKNLRLHSSIKLTARFAEEVNGHNSGISVHQIKEFMPDYSFGCSISNLPFLAAGLSDNGVNPLQLEDDWTHYTTYYAMIGDGEGSVSSIPGINRPIVRFKVSDHGMALLAEATRNLGKVLFAAGAETLYPSIGGHGPLRSDSDLDRLPNRLSRDTVSLMTIHVMGTCPMGNNSRGCVEATGRLKGTKNIYIADASIIPTALGANPQGTVMALTRHNAMRFVQEGLR